VSATIAPEPVAPSPDDSKFAVRLDNFEGPFDLLLGLIAKHKLDITEVALSKVTDEFIEYIKARGPQWDLEQTTEFLVVASTLLDLKASRLIPHAEVEDEEDLALLEARDLLFARLLQYRAYKQVAAMLAERMARESRQVGRTVGLEERFAGLLPEVLIGLGPDEFAALAARALTPKPEPTLGLGHLHAPRVSVREQAAIVVTRLRRHRSTTFRALASDSPDTLTTVARFLSLLELFREGVVAFEQVSPLGELHVRWTGSDEGEIEVTDEFDGAPEPPSPAGDQSEDDQGEDDQGEDDQTEDDQSEDDQSEDDQGEDDQGEDDQGEDDQGEDDQGGAEGVPAGDRSEGPGGGEVTTDEEPA
jgi:segregation and condensation protein A